jgi:hypothetical protein
MLEILPGTGRGTVRSTVEGAPRPLDNPLNDRIHVFQNLGRGNAKNAYAALAKTLVANLITFDAHFVVVGAAVDLDAEPHFAAVEINDVSIEPMLAPELQSAGTSSKPLPQKHFGQ